jgi:hypothetical protein
MDKQVNTTAELNLSDDVLRALLDSEVLLIGGGEACVNYN